jgi:Tc5 transposase DNA-binding domain
MSIVSRTRGKNSDRKNGVSLQPSKSTLWRRARGRLTLKDKAIRQQYLTPYEEEALVRYVLEYAKRGYPLPAKSLRSLALIIARRRGSNDPNLHLSGKNWPQGFYKRHLILKAKTLKALDRARHDHNVYGKIVDWFTLIGQELRKGIYPKNVYNMDETDVLLSYLTSRKVLVSSHDLRRYRGAAVNRTLITAIECIAADGSYLVPLIVWPSATTRNNWYTHPTPH